MWFHFLKKKKKKKKKNEIKTLAVFLRAFPDYIIRSNCTPSNSQISNVTSRDKKRKKHLSRLLKGPLTVYAHLPHIVKYKELRNENDMTPSLL